MLKQDLFQWRKRKHVSCAVNLKFRQENDLQNIRKSFTQTFIESANKLLVLRRSGVYKDNKQNGCTLKQYL
jgi:hypothetical protein